MDVAIAFQTQFHFLNDDDDDDDGARMEGFVRYKMVEIDIL